MRRKLITTKVTHNVLIPGWIAAFGLVVVTNPPLGAAASVGLFVVGVCVLPAAVLFGGAAGWRAQHG